LLQKKRLARNAIPTPASMRRIRLRSSSRCSRKDMRNMPSSSSPSSLGGGGGGILPPPPEDFAGSGGAAGGDNVSAPAPPCVSEYWETLYPYASSVFWEYDTFGSDELPFSDEPSLPGVGASLLSP